MADAVGQAEVGKEGKGPAGMTCLVYSRRSMESPPTLRPRRGSGVVGALNHSSMNVDVIADMRPRPHPLMSNK